MASTISPFVIAFTGARVGPFVTGTTEIAPFPGKAMVNPGVLQASEAEMMGVKRFVDPEAESLREIVRFEVHPDVTIPSTMFQMCPVFGQRRKEVQRVAPENVGAGAAADVGGGDDAKSRLVGAMIDSLRPCGFGSVAYVEDYKMLGPSVRQCDYRIYVEFVDIVIDDFNAADMLRELPVDLFLFPDLETDVSGERLTLRIADNHNDHWNVFQDEHHIVIVQPGNVNAFTMGKIVGLSVRDNRSTVELEYANEGAAIDALSMIQERMCKLYWVPGVDTSPGTVLQALQFFETRDLTAPVNIYGISSRFEDAYAAGAAVAIPTIMLGSAFLLVQPDFYDVGEVWVPGDSIYALLERVYDASFSTVKRYSIRYVHYEEAVQTPAPNLYFYVGMYCNTSDDAYYRCCTISIPSLVQQPIIIGGT